VVPYRQKKYMQSIKQLNNPAASADYQRDQDTIALFEKYGRQYGFDPLMLAAQGYQELATRNQAWTKTRRAMSARSA
jgi:hypothetical protein